MKAPPPTLEDFVAAVQRGVDCWVEAGELLVAIVAREPRALESIVSAHPWITRDALLTFLQLGRRELDPRLVIDQSPGALKMRQLPFAEQQRLLDAKIAVATRQGDVVHRRFNEMTGKEAAMVFGQQGVRSIPEQRQLLSRRAPTCGRNPKTSKVEEEPVESLDGDDPGESIDAHLAGAQQRLLRSRELLTIEHVPLDLDRHITAALLEIGKLRLALKERGEDARATS